MRYIGYAGMLGNTFRSLLKPEIVSLCHSATIIYIILDVIYQSLGTLNVNKHIPNILCYEPALNIFIPSQLPRNYDYNGTIVAAGDALIWHALATVVILALLVKLTSAAAVAVLDAFVGENSRLHDLIPIGAGSLWLMLLPAVRWPIDNIVDGILNVTYRMAYKK